MSRVLVCDDDVELRYIVRYFLERKGIEVIEAENGKVATELLQAEVVDALVIDLLMPLQDGYTTVELLRKESSTKNLPIVVLSSMGQEDNLLRALKLGASDFLKKPFSPEELYLRLLRFLPAGNK